MIVLQIDTIRYQAQTKLVNLGVENYNAYEEGKLAEDALEQGLSIIELLKALEYKDFLSIEEQENILYCLIEIAEINDYPASPQLSPLPKPDILVGLPGATGPKGDTGPSGEGNVNVISNPTYDNINVIKTSPGGVDTYALGYDPYIVSFAGMSIDNGLYREIGSSENVNFTASIDNGREAIVTQTITSPITPTWTTDPQAFVDSAVVIVSRTTRAYTARVDDGTTIDTDTKNVEFVYPIFYGSSPNILTGAQVYSQLTKLVALIGNKNIPYSFVDEYAYFAFDDAYDDSSIVILDENGFDVTSEFTKVDYDGGGAGQVDSGATHAGGGGTDWQKDYIVYRTTVKTTIAGTFQFLNVTE